MVTHEGKIIIQVYVPVPMPPNPAGPRGLAFWANPRCKANRDAMPEPRGFLINPQSQISRTLATASALPLANPLTGHSQTTILGAILAQTG